MARNAGGLQMLLQTRRIEPSPTVRIDTRKSYRARKKSLDEDLAVAASPLRQQLEELLEQHDVEHTGWLSAGLIRELLAPYAAQFVGNQWNILRRSLEGAQPMSYSRILALLFGESVPLSSTGSGHTLAAAAAFNPILAGPPDQAQSPEHTLPPPAVVSAGTPPMHAAPPKAALATVYLDAALPSPGPTSPLLSPAHSPIAPRSPAVGSARLASPQPARSPSPLPAATKTVRFGPGITQSAPEQSLGPDATKQQPTPAPIATVARADVEPRLAAALAKEKSTLLARCRRLDSGGLGLLSVAAFRPILECSVGRLTDAQFAQLLSDPRQLSLPTHVDYRVVVDCSVSAQPSPSSKIEQAVRALSGMNLDALVGPDGEVHGLTLRRALQGCGVEVDGDTFKSLLAHLGFMHTFPAQSPAVYEHRYTTTRASLQRRLSLLRDLAQPVDAARHVTGSLYQVAAAPQTAPSKSAKAAKPALSNSIPAARARPSAPAAGTSLDLSLSGPLPSTDAQTSQLDSPSATAQAPALSAAAPDAPGPAELYSSPSLVTPVGLVTGLPPRDLKPGKQSSTVAQGLPGVDSLRFDDLLNATRVGGMPEKLFATLPAKPHAGRDIVETIRASLQSKVGEFLVALRRHDPHNTGLVARNLLRRELQTLVGPLSGAAFALLSRECMVPKDQNVPYVAFVRRIFPDRPEIFASALPPAPSVLDLASMHKTLRGPVVSNAGELHSSMTRADKLKTGEIPDGVFITLLSEVAGLDEQPDSFFQSVCEHWRGRRPDHVAYLRFLLFFTKGAPDRKHATNAWRTATAKPDRGAVAGAPPGASMDPLHARLRHSLAPHWRLVRRKLRELDRTHTRRVTPAALTRCMQAFGVSLSESDIVQLNAVYDPDLVGSLEYTRLLDVLGL